MNNKPFYRQGDKVIMRLNGQVLKFGDIAYVKDVDFLRSDPYFLSCPLRCEGEWMNGSFFDKHQERPAIIKSPFFERRKQIPEDEPKAEIVRHPAVYDNIKTYKYDEEKIK